VGDEIHGAQEDKGNGKGNDGGDDVIQGSLLYL
jgi:hypothetical protein